MRVTLYTKPDCGLCVEAEVVLRRIQKAIRFELDLVNIETDSAVFERYWDRIPVIVRNGEEVAAAPIDERRLEAALRR